MPSSDCSGIYVPSFVKHLYVYKIGNWGKIVVHANEVENYDQINQNKFPLLSLIFTTTFDKICWKRENVGNAENFIF